MTQAPGGGSGRELSIARLALCSMGAAAGVLLVVSVVILAVRPGPAIGLVIALVGVAGAIAAMGIVSKRMTRRAYGPAVQDEADPAVQDEADPAVQDEADGSGGDPAAGTGG